MAGYHHDKEEEAYQNALARLRAGYGDWMYEGFERDIPVSDLDDEYDDPRIRDFEIYTAEYSFPDFVGESAVDSVNTVIALLNRDEGQFTRPASQPIEMLVKTLRPLRMLIDRVLCRPHIPSSEVDRSELQNHNTLPTLDPARHIDAFVYSQAELEKVPDSAFEGVLDWCTWLLDTYMDKLQQCIPVTLPPLAFDRIAQMLSKADGGSLGTLSEGRSPAAEVAEGRLIAGCSVAAVQLFKLAFYMLYHRSNFKMKSSVRLLHHIQIFGGAMEAYEAFLEESSDLPVVICNDKGDKDEKRGIIPTNHIASFTFPGSSRSVFAPYFSLLHYCAAEDTYLLYAMYDPKQPEVKTDGYEIKDPLFSPPVIFPSEEFFGAVGFHPTKGGKIVIFRLNSDYFGDAPLAEFNCTGLSTGLNVDIQDITNLHLTPDPDYGDYILMVFQSTDTNGAPSVSILHFNQFQIKFTLSVVAVVPGASLACAMRTRYCLQEGSTLVLYDYGGSHQEIARTDSDPSNPWNVRFDVSFARRCLFYRGNEVQVRAFDLTITRRITLDSVPSDPFHLSLHGNTVFGQSEGKLNVISPKVPALPYLTPFVMTLDHPKPVYLPQYPMLKRNVMTVYAGQLTADGKVEILKMFLMGIGLGVHPTPTIIHNLSFEVFPGSSGTSHMIRRDERELKLNEDKLRPMTARRIKKLKKKASQQKKRKIDEVEARKQKHIKLEANRIKSLSRARVQLQPHRVYSGVVTKWSKSYGFAKTVEKDESGIDRHLEVFVHESSVGGALRVGEKIRFELDWKQGMDRPKAYFVEVV